MSLPFFDIRGSCASRLNLMQCMGNRNDLFWPSMDNGRSFMHVDQIDMKSTNSDLLFMPKSSADSMKSKRMSKKKRLTREQVVALESRFQEDRTLDADRKQDLARRLDLEPRQIAVWFQNRRARSKTKHLEHEFSLLQSNFASVFAETQKLRAEVTRLSAELEAATSKCSHEGASFRPKPACQNVRQCDVEQEGNKATLIMSNAKKAKSPSTSDSDNGNARITASSADMDGRGSDTASPVSSYGCQHHNETSDHGFSHLNSSIPTISTSTPFNRISPSVVNLMSHNFVSVQSKPYETIANHHIHFLNESPFYSQSPNHVGLECIWERTST